MGALAIDGNIVTSEGSAKTTTLIDGTNVIRVHVFLDRKIATDSYHTHPCLRSFLFGHFTMGVSDDGMTFTFERKHE